MVVTLELKEISRNPALIKQYSGQGVRVMVFEQGSYLFDATYQDSETPDNHEKACTDAPDGNPFETYFAQEILRVEQLESTGNLKSRPVDEFLAEFSENRESLPSV
jgi:hypothetical protein